MARAFTFALFAASAGLVSGQYEGWVANQVNASIALWAQPRAAVIRDTIYLDGGYMYWMQGLADGSYGAIDQQDNPMGLIFTLNFSQPFETKGNVTGLFNTISKARGGTGNANNEAPNYYDGAMLANDAFFSLYGGLVRKTSSYSAPAADDVLTYEAFTSTDRQQFEPGFRRDTLPDGMTRYVAFGGAVNVPSENKAFYFSGMRGPEWGEVFTRSANMSENAANVSSTLITLDMERQSRPVWSNDTLPDKIKGRANPEVVWVPVGEQGILVAIGGVTYPDWVSAPPLRESENPAQSKEESDEFMRVIDIYDIASGNWSKQETEGAPLARTRGCAVMSPAKDYSSFNIYYYGGYSGVDPREDMNDEVWVLSIPSFTWTKISEGRRDYGRNGHKCFMPYPDQMMVIGGMTSISGGSLASLMGGLIQVYNLTTGEWLDGYDPEKYGDYGVPSAVVSVIGGDATGSAVMTTPSAGWTEDGLADIFGQSYDKSKIQTWGPYEAIKPTDRPIVNDPPTDNDDDKNDKSGGGGLPSWAAPTLGVVLGLVFITALLVAFCLWRKRKILRRRGYTEPSTDDNGTRILSWIRGQPAEHKALTVTTTEDIPSNAEMAEVRGFSDVPPVPVPAPTPAPSRFEMPDTAIAELPDTSRPPELSDTGLSPVEVINKHSRLGASPPLASTNGQTSYYGSVSGNEASSLSRSSGVLGASSRSDSPTRGPPSPSLGGPNVPNARILSGVSAFSERETGHLRNISEATVSSASDAGNDSQAASAADGHISSASSRANPPRSLPPGMFQAHNPLSPIQGTPSPLDPGAISPPTAGATSEDSDDYITARRLAVGPNETASPRRRSVFRENEDDMAGIRR